MSKLFSFTKRYTFLQRKEECNRIITKFPDRVPVICERHYQTNSIPNIDKNKYLVPYDISIGQFMYVIRKRIRLNQDEALFLFVNNMIPATSESMQEVYNRLKSEDGFLYIMYSAENTFG